MNKNAKFWIALLLTGFLGQLAWTIENMYFNVFVYNTISANVDVIARMVALSAITATVTTLFMGYLSDKMAKRKLFICLGYIIWGFSLLAFAFLSIDNITKLLPTVNAVALGGWLAIIMDCIMTFFGSTANDACFNAWVTDSTDKSSRNRVESVLATLPLLSMLVVFGLLDGLTQQGQWSKFFMIVGILVSLGGVIGLFVIDEPKIAPTENTSVLTNLANSITKESILSNKELYLSLLCLLCLSVSTQIFMPYMIIYITDYLQITNYALILGIVLLGASIISILAGRIISIMGADTFYVPSVVLLAVGLIMMFLSRSPFMVVIAGLIMMSGNLIVTSLINSSIRNYTPVNQVGQFQGIRMIFGVMLPMIIGPFIGAWVIKGSNSTYEDLGVIKQVPTPGIWLASAIVALLIIIPYHFIHKQQAEKLKHHRNLVTPFAEKMNKNKPLTEYPRPQMVRNSYINLNGLWDYAITKTAGIPVKYDGQILVPFSPETTLSKVKRTLLPDEYLYYRCVFLIPEGFNKGLVHLNFGAVDQKCRVYLNDSLIGEHTGGYLPFSFEISKYLDKRNELIVEVRDFTDTSYYSRGKQSFNRGGIWYTPQSGIWQTVWLESTPKQYIKNIRITPDYDNARVNIKVDGNEEKYTYVIKTKEKEITRVIGNSNVDISLPDFHSWSPEDPFLYDLDVFSDNDYIKSYFGMRKFSIERVHGIRKIFLNNKPYFMKGVLDQGYWPDGLYTACSDEALIYDIKTMKEMGFNTLRKHIKIEPMRWYYHCDKLGMLVWQDMVSGGTAYSFLTIGALPFINVKLKDSNYKQFSRDSEESRDDYYRELKETVNLLYNVPSLALWVPFNEGWGQFDSEKAYMMIKEMDNTRLIDHASGWHDQGIGDFNSKHIYFNKIKFKYEGRAMALTEYGGYSWLISEHSYNDAGYGYKLFNSQEELQEAFRQLHEKEIRPEYEKGLSAIIYTQVSDVEDEVNGLLTYDRKVKKFEPEFVKQILDQMK
ncbi:MAG: MFS transporter [Erysipelotrichaceae bacterium]|nr:MFS transporter [Erysipelotrichaceae bacterium]